MLLLTASAGTGVGPDARQSREGAGRVHTLEGMGSDMAKRGSARLAKVLRYLSMGTACTTLYSSRHTKPARQNIFCRMQITSTVKTS